MPSRCPIAAYRRIIVQSLLAGLVGVAILGVREASAAQLTASWTDNSGGLASFQVDRRKQSDAAFTAVGDVPVGATSYVDPTVTEGVTYCYRVKAYNDFGDSPYSEEACSSVATSTYSITVTKAGAGAGTVASNPAGISCGTDCSEAYTSGALVTLAATAAAGSRFDGWSGGGCSGTDPCSITGNAPVTVTATFSVVGHSITVTKAGTGTGAVTSNPAGISCGTDCSELYTSGTALTLAATAAAGSQFDGWSGGCAGTGSCTITVNAPAEVTATFSVVPSPTTYSVTVTKAGTGTGTVASSPTGISCGSDCSEPYTSGAVVTLAATAAAGSQFDGWSGGCTGTGSCTITASAPVEVTATFSAVPTSSLTVTKTGTGTGTVTSNPTGISCGTDCGELYTSGTVVTLAAAAATGSQFDGWTGACAGSGSCTVTASEPTLVTATFSVLPATTPTTTITVTKAGAGAGTVASNPTGITCGSDCSELYTSGTVVILAATAATGSKFDGWSGGCSGTAECTVTASASVDVTAKFSKVRTKPAPGPKRTAATVDSTSSTSTSTAVAAPATSETTSGDSSTLSSLQTFASGVMQYPIVAAVRNYVEPLFTSSATAATPPTSSTTAPTTSTLGAGTSADPQYSSTIVFAGSPPTTAAPAPATRDALVRPTTTHRLSARFTERTWIRVRMDDGRALKETVRAGDERTWISNGSFVISVGNAGAVTLTLDGQPLPPLGARGTAVSGVTLPPEAAPPQ